MTVYTPINREVTTYTTEANPSIDDQTGIVIGLLAYTYAGTTRHTYTAENRNITTYTTVNRN
jgi:hypothetical protein